MNLGVLLTGVLYGPALEGLGLAVCDDEPPCTPVELNRGDLPTPGLPKIAFLRYA